MLVISKKVLVCLVTNWKHQGMIVFLAALTGQFNTKPLCFLKALVFQFLGVLLIKGYLCWLVFFINCNMGIILIYIQTLFILFHLQYMLPCLLASAHQNSRPPSVLVWTAFMPTSNPSQPNHQNTKNTKQENPILCL